MILYHFTRPAYVDSIKRTGLIRGDVPITMSGGFNAPWLTSDAKPVNQKWVVGTDKQKVRFTVNVKDDAKLRHWPTYAKAVEMEEKWYDILDHTGGGGSNNWYIYLGRIPPSWLIDVTYL